MHGAREDVTPAESQGVEALRGWCEGARPRRSAEQMPEVRPRKPEVAEIVGRLTRAGFRAAAIDLAPASLGVHVVKAIIPGFQLSELL